MGNPRENSSPAGIEPLSLCRVDTDNFAFNSDIESLVHGLGLALDSHCLVVDDN